MWWSVWPDKNRQMSIKVAQKWMILTPLQKLPKNVGDLGKFIVAKGLKNCPKCKKIAQSGHTGGDVPLARMFVQWKINLIPIRILIKLRVKNQ